MLTVQLLVLVVLAIYAKAGAVMPARPISDFYASGHLVPGLLNGMAVAIAVVGVLAYAGFAGVLSQGRQSAWLLAGAGTAALILIALLIAPYLRKFGGYTLPDFLGERFGTSGARPLAVLAVILCSFPPLALVLIGLGALAARIFEVSSDMGIALGALMLLVCSLAAGMRSASLTQIVQYAVLIAASVVALINGFAQAGTLPGVFSNDLDKAVAAMQLDSFAAQDPVNRMAMLFCLVAGTASLPHLLHRAFVTPTVEGARASFLWALPFAAILCVVAGPYSSLFAPGASGDFAATAAFSLVAIGAIAALLATGTGLLLAIANALSYDLYYKSAHLTAPTGQRLLIARAALVLVATAAVLAAVKTPGRVKLTTGAAFSLAASAFLPALLLGIWWKRATPEGALAGMLAGLVVCLYYMLAPRYIPFAFYESSSFLSDATQDVAARYAALRENYYLAADEAGRQAALVAWQSTARAVANWGGIKGDFAAVFAVPAGVLAMIGVSLFTPAPSREVQRFVEDLRKPRPQPA
jgi:cation/acetate symporter